MNLPSKQVIPIILIVVSLGLGFLSWQIYSDVPTVQGQIDDYKIKNTNLEDTSGKIETFAAFVKENPNVIGNIDYILPDDDNKPNMVSIFGNLAFLNGIMLKKVNFSVPQTVQVVVDPSQPLPPADDYETQVVKLNFTGTYQAFKSFIGEIGNSLKIMDITLVDFKPVVNDNSDQNNGENKNPQPAPTQPQPGNYDFEVNIKTYYFKKIAGGEKVNPTALYNVDKLASFDFAKTAQYNSLSIPTGYNVDTTDTGDLTNKNPF